MRAIILLTLLCSLTLAAACSRSMPPVPGSAGLPGHPALSEQQMLTACHDCHRRVTPEVFSSWHDSGHGIGQVKCYQCHGTYEELKAEPSLEACAVCHSGQFEHAGGRTCWQCHPAHSFEARN